MTKEEKAKAYDEALEKTKELLDSLRTCFDINQLKDIFLELHESDDERIRKILIKTIGYFRSRGIDQQLCEEFLTYLERQKEDYSSFDEEQRKYMERYIPLDKVTLVKLLAERDMNVAASIKSFNECFTEKE